MYQKLGNKRETGLLRANSICPTPESVLLDLVKANDVQNITRLVTAHKELLSRIYTPDYNKPILLIACTEDGVQAETVKTLIDLGGDLHYSSEIDEDWQAIHFAAYTTNPDILQVVINKLNESGGINACAKGNNALHILIKHGRSDLQEEFSKCAEILVRSGIDINQGDVNNVSAILWAAKKGYRDIIKIILQKSIVAVDIDSHQSRKKTARDIILNDNLYDGVLPEKIDNMNLDEKQILFTYIKNNNESGFINFKNGDIFHLVDSDDNSITLLQLCCEKGLIKATEHLLDKGADPNKITDKNRKLPIEIATENGFHEIFKILLSHPKIHVPREVLITLLKYIDHQQFPTVNHEKCYKMLIEKMKSDRSLLDINEIDQVKNTPLHYAIRYGDSENVDELLRLGASLGAKNRYEYMPVQDMEPELLEKHLNSCIEFDIKGKKFDKDDFSVTFNYRTLIPPSKKIYSSVSYSESNDPETNLSTVIEKELVAETEVISYMSQASEFKHLLKHPVIVSFLFMKWHRIRWLFFTNLAFYVTFFLSLVVYIFTDYAYFYSDEKSGFHNFIIQMSWVILLLTCLILVLRELFQIAVAPKNYFKNFENYIEIILIFLTGAILFIKNPSLDTRKQLSSIAILLAAFELVLMLGQHPKLSTNVVMLKTVSFNFFKFLMWYSLLIFAFALSFYILFTETDQANTDSGNKNTTDDGEEENSFNDPAKSVFKTIVMLTGEFDAGSINFHTFPVTSKLIFTLFIFMIAIILLNLLNGLAVSDTQMIKNDAELVGHIARAQHIRYVESMLVGNILPINVLNKINSLCCCLPFDNNWNFSISKSVAKSACLFPHYLNYELTVFPNKYGLVSLPQEFKKTSFLNKNCADSCRCVYLDRETIKRTNEIVQARRENLKMKTEESYLNKLESIIQNLEQNANNDKVEIYMLHKKLDNILRHVTQSENGDS